MKKVYVETTVVSYFTAKPSRDPAISAHQRATRTLWPRLISEFDTHVSSLVHEEAGRGDVQESGKRLKAISTFEMLDIDPAVRTLARAILDGKGIPEGHPDDAFHIAVASVNGMDVLLTWNFAHINNPFTCLMIRQIVENAGYRCPEICSPEALLEAMS